MNTLEEMRKVITERIKSERLNAGYKQGELSKKIGKAENAISGYETGDRLPPIDVLHQLADIFNCSTDYLLGRNTNRNCLADHRDETSYTLLFKLSNQLTKQEKLQLAIKLLNDVNE